METKIKWRNKFQFCSLHHPSHILSIMDLYLGAVNDKDGYIAPRISSFLFFGYQKNGPFDVTVETMTGLSSYFDLFERQMG